MLRIDGWQMIQQPGWRGMHFIPHVRSTTSYRQHRVARCTGCVRCAIDDHCSRYLPIAGGANRRNHVQDPYRSMNAACSMQQYTRHVLEASWERRNVSAHLIRGMSGAWRHPDLHLEDKLRLSQSMLAMVDKAGPPTAGQAWGVSPPVSALIGRAHCLIRKVPRRCWIAFAPQPKQPRMPWNDAVEVMRGFCHARDECWSTVCTV